MENNNFISQKNTFKNYRIIATKIENNKIAIFGIYHEPNLKEGDILNMNRNGYNGKYKILEIKEI